MFPDDGDAVGGVDAPQPAVKIVITRRLTAHNGYFVNRRILYTFSGGINGSPAGDWSLKCFPNSPHSPLFV
jgi:hypothetical protein